MKRLLGCLIPILFAAWAISGCGGSSTSSGETGTLKVSLTDAPAGFEAVNVTFSEISANIDDAWITVQNQTQTVNLLEWSNGKTLVLGTAEVPAGDYTQIRLIIDAAEVVLDGQAHAVTVPSGPQTGLKLVAEFTVNEGSTYELVLDFDAERSVVKLGTPQNPLGYILNPTIRVIPMATTGSISGTVTNPENLPVAYAIAGSDTLTSTHVDTSGAFMLAFLPEGAYSVAIEDTQALSFTQSDVEVTPGSDYDLGKVTLK